jgi:preprotein translocase subunit SecA
MLNIVKKIVGTQNERVLKRIGPLVQRINEFEPEISKLTDAELRAKTDEFRARIGAQTASERARLEELQALHQQTEAPAADSDGDAKDLRTQIEEQDKELREAENRVLEDILPEAFAVVREASKRTTGLRHFDVQFIGCTVLHHGTIAEMKTGEGKTLVATGPLYLNALTGRGAHLVTVNDYLARRDVQWMGPIYHLLGLTVASIVHDTSFLFDPTYVVKDYRMLNLRPIERKDAYLADITYGTNHEFGFDYLRDNMKFTLEEYVQRELNYAIVDEVDNILIDEARTPLIISGPAEESTDKYYVIDRIIPRLKKGERKERQGDAPAEESGDFWVDEKSRSAVLTEQGVSKVERMLAVPNLYDPNHIDTLHHVNQALKAHAIFHRDVDYIVKDGQVIIVDEFTGRLMPGRRWSDGLHQAVEAKEGLKVQQEQKTLATITLQNFFRLYAKLAGMTGTAVTEAEEFHKIYKLEVVTTPTNKPMVRTDHPDVIYKTEESKFEAVIDEVIEMNKQGRPVLVGTVSVEKSERLARMLEKRGLPHSVLNAKQHEREAAIVKDAGQQGAVMIATNMAGRGTDIVLGAGVRESGGLHIIGTERHESRRIDNQLRGRSGRQGDPGSSRFFISLEDDLMKIFGPAADRIGNLMDRLEVEPIEHKWVAGSIESAQKKVEGRNFDSRKHVVEYDDVMNKQREIIYGERRKVLEGADTRDNIEAYIRELVDKGIEVHCQSRHPENWDLDGLVRYLGAFFPIPPGSQIPPEVLARGSGAVADLVHESAIVAYQAKEDQVGVELMRSVERWVMLHTIDTKWVDYLTQMEHFREGIGLVAYGQRDPLIEYKNEAFTMFQELSASIQAEIVANMFRVQVNQEPAPQPARPIVERGPAQPGGALTGGNGQGDGGGRERVPAAVATAAASGKVGRNDPCPCGSGKKYKRCHGR